MSNKAKGTTRTVLMLSIFSFLSKILGFLRVSLISSKYGTQSSYDAFVLALAGIGIFTTVVSNTIGTTLIPVLGEVESKEGKQGKRDHLNNFVTIIATVSIILTVVGIIFTPVFMKLFARGFKDNEELFALVVKLTRIGFPTVVTSSLIGVFRGYLQSEGMFKESATAGLLTNIIMITFLLVLADKFDVEALMIAYVIASSAPLIVQLYSLKSTGYTYDYLMDLSDKYMRRVISMLPPVLIGVAVTDINKIVDNTLASSLPTGSVSAMDYALRLDSITTGIFVASIMTVVFPMLSIAANEKDRAGLKKATIKGINTILLVTIPAAIGMMVLATPIVTLAFQRGKFDALATQMTAGALKFFSLGVVFSAIKGFSYRVFYSIQDTKTPVINSAVTVAFNIIFNLMLVKSMQHEGLALATSMAHFVTSFLILFLLRRKMGPFGFKESFIVGIKSLVASLIMGVFAFYSYNYFISLVPSGKLGLSIALFSSVLLSAGLYFVLTLLFRIEEVHFIVSSFKRKLQK